MDQKNSDILSNNAISYNESFYTGSMKLVFEKIHQSTKYEVLSDHMDPVSKFLFKRTSHQNLIFFAEKDYDLNAVYIGIVSTPTMRAQFNNMYIFFRDISYNHVLRLEKKKSLWCDSFENLMSYLELYVERVNKSLYEEQLPLYNHLASKNYFFVLSDSAVF